MRAPSGLGGGERYPIVGGISGDGGGPKSTDDDKDSSTDEDHARLHYEDKDSSTDEDQRDEAPADSVRMTN